MTDVLRCRPTASYVHAIRFAEDGSNWRDFAGWCGWDIIDESKKWWPDPEPDKVPSLDFVTIDSYGDEVDITLERGDWLVVTDGGDKAKYPDGIFQKMYQEFS